MVKNEVIEELAENRVVENMVHSMKASVGENPENIRELISDVYLIICEMDDDKIIELYAKGQLKFYISRIITNQLCSKTSPYYITWKKINKVDIDKLPL